MKRSYSFRMALLGAGAIGLAACGEGKEEALTYVSVEACSSAGVQDEATCRVEFENAQAQHANVAPRYSSQNSCQGDFGFNNCRVHRTSTGSIWLPLMVGYMMAPRIGSSVYTQPLYRPSRDPRNFYTAGSTNVGRAVNGPTQVSRSSVSKPPARTRTVSRGGFGSRSVSAGG